MPKGQNKFVCHMCVCSLSLAHWYVKHRKVVWCANASRIKEPSAAS